MGSRYSGSFTMKILLVSPFENQATGRGDRNMRLEAELRGRGHDVTFVTSDFDHARKAMISRSALASRSGLWVVHVPGYRDNVSLARMWTHFLFALKLWLRAFLTRWDAVVISSVPPDGLIAAKFLRKKSLIIDIRDIWPDALEAYGRPSSASRAFGAFCHMIYGSTLKRANRILIAAPGFRNWLARYGALEHRRVKFVPLGFPREDFRPLSSGGTEWDFCYAGGATPQFDIREFAPEFANRRGIVLGSGPLLNAWRGSFPNTEFRGAVRRNEAMDLMSRSRQLLFPSNPFAQLPNKAFDYFALGHPVVLGENCTRATRSLTALRWRRAINGEDYWEDYRSLEKEALAKRAATIIEDSIR